MALANRWPAAIVSADSRQVYREFDIGTAKPSEQDRRRVPHFLVDICEPTATLTVADYQQQAQTVLAQLHQQGKRLPLLVGGSGLYVDAVAKGLKIPQVAPQPELRSQLMGWEQAHRHQLLCQVDAAAAQRIHPNDSVRTLRALEVYYVTGEPMSAQQGECPPDYPILYIGLTCEVSTLRSRIAERTEQMIAAGFVEEVVDLRNRYGPDLPLLQTLGYAEISQYLQGEKSLAEATDAIVQHTCQFAKRQRTWFRKHPQIHWFPLEPAEDNSPSVKPLIHQVGKTVEEFLQAANA